MPCQHVKLPDGTTAIACSRRGRKPPRCVVQHCGAEAVALCDYPKGAGKTCDWHLCARHARNVGPDRHYCPYHYQLHEKENVAP